MSQRVSTESVLRILPSSTPTTIQRKEALEFSRFLTKVFNGKDFDNKTAVEDFASKVNNAHSNSPYGEQVFTEVLDHDGSYRVFLVYSPNGINNGSVGLLIEKTKSNKVNARVKQFNPLEIEIAQSYAFTPSVNGQALSPENSNEAIKLINLDSTGSILTGEFDINFNTNEITVPSLAERLSRDQEVNLDFSYVPAVKITAGQGTSNNGVNFTPANNATVHLSIVKASEDELKETDPILDRYLEEVFFKDDSFEVPRPLNQALESYIADIETYFSLPPANRKPFLISNSYLNNESEDDQISISIDNREDQAPHYITNLIFVPDSFPSTGGSLEVIISKFDEPFNHWEFNSIENHALNISANGSNGKLLGFQNSSDDYDCVCLTARVDMKDEEVISQHEVPTTPDKVIANLRFRATPPISLHVGNEDLQA